MHMLPKRIPFDLENSFSLCYTLEIYSTWLEKAWESYTTKNWTINQFVIPNQIPIKLVYIAIIIIDDFRHLRLFVIHIKASILNSCFIYIILNDVFT